MIIGLFAIDDGNGIGIDGRLPWPHNKDDMKWFKSTTEQQIVVMGKNTWNSCDMPKPLPGRLNILVTNKFIENPHIEQFRGDIPEALTLIKDSNPDKNIFVIGGVNVLLQARPVLEKLYITRIPGEYQSDVKLDLASFLENFNLINTINLNSCNVEEYQNETISRSTRRNPK